MDYAKFIATLSGIAIIVAAFALALGYLLRKKKKDRRLIVIVPVLTAVLIGAGFFWGGGFSLVTSIATKFLPPGSPSGPGPKQTLEKACQYLTTGDYGSYYDLFSPNSPTKKTFTRSQSAQGLAEIIGLQGGYSQCIVQDNIEEDGDSAKGILSLITGLGRVHDKQYILDKENNQWNILADHDVTSTSEVAPHQLITSNVGVVPPDGALQPTLRSVTVWETRSGAPALVLVYLRSFLRQYLRQQQTIKLSLMPTRAEAG